MSQQKWSISPNRWATFAEITYEKGNFIRHEIWKYSDDKIKETHFAPQDFFNPFPPWYQHHQKSAENIREIQKIMHESAQLVNGENLEGDSLKSWKFWKHYIQDTDGKVLKLKGKNFTLYLHEGGANWTYTGALGEKEYGRETVANLFFRGPKHGFPDLVERSKLILRILEDLSPGHGLSIWDAFPIIEYSEIPKGKWEYEVSDDMRSGRWIAIYDDKVGKGGWDPPDSGGEGFFSFEHFLTNLYHRQEVPKEILKKVLDNIEMGVRMPPKKGKG